MVRNKSLEGPTGLTRPRKMNRGGALPCVLSACPAHSLHREGCWVLKVKMALIKWGQGCWALLTSSHYADPSPSILHLPSPAPSTKNTRLPCMEMWVSHSQLSPKNAFLNWCFGECRIHWLQYVFTPDFKSFSVENWRRYLATISSPRYSSSLFFFFLQVIFKDSIDHCRLSPALSTHQDWMTMGECLGHSRWCKNIHERNACK